MKLVSFAQIVDGNPSAAVDLSVPAYEPYFLTGREVLFIVCGESDLNATVDLEEYVGGTKDESGTGAWSGGTWTASEASLAIAASECTRMALVVIEEPYVRVHASTYVAGGARCYLLATN